MITIDHAFKVANRIFPDRTKIDMNTHDDADKKACKNVKQVGKIEPTESNETLNGDFRI